MWCLLVNHFYPGVALPACSSMEEYEKLRCLGQGVAGSVYLVKNKLTNRHFAIKKIQLDESKKSRRREFVEKEAQILAQLRHPHIVSFYDSFFESQPEATFLCIVQDYCEGGSLDVKIAEHRKRDERFEENTIMQWFIQLAMAVQYIHSHKILHRDLKTQNVFLTRNEVVKLGDFGIARSLEHTLDKAVTMVGTPSHMSPELCQDLPYNSKSDIWALGCLLFEVAAFEPAFDSHNLLGLIFKIVKGEHADIPSIYSEDFHHLIASMLQKDPEKRPSASTLLNLPFVSTHLNHFIDEKESQRQSWALKKLSLKRPCSADNIRCDANGNLRDVRGQRSSCSSALESREYDITAAGDSTKSVELAPSPVVEPTDQGEYSDDFLSSDEDDERPTYSPEEGPSDKEGLSEESFAADAMEDHLGSTTGKSPNRTHSSLREDDEEYPDDFEPDSDEDLDEIVSHAKCAADIGANGYDDDSFEDGDDGEDSGSCKQLIERHCKDVLGEDVFNKIQQRLKTQEEERISPSDLCLEFEHHIGSDLKETCYILSEFLSGKDGT